MKKIPIIKTCIVLILMTSCNSLTRNKVITLTENEKIFCDTLQIDSSIIHEIRRFNTNLIEPFHYSLSKTIENGKESEVDPIFLKGIVFKEQHSKSYDIVFNLKNELKRKGYTIILLENNFNIGHQQDVIGVLKTADKYEVLKEIQTDGINYDISNDSLRNIIRQLDKKYSLELIGASGDWCEFVIHNEPKDWLEFAKEIYKICPDVVDQGTGSLNSLADEMKKTKRLYFWWD